MGGIVKYNVRPGSHKSTYTPLRLHGAYSRCLAVPNDDPIIGKSVLDTLPVWSMTATKDVPRVVPIPLSKQPIIEGAGGDTMRSTHWVHRDPDIRATTCG